MFRLDLTERFALAKAAQTLPSEAEAWLFGSRIHKTARGGDIDILVRSANEVTRLQTSVDFISTFQMHCDQKIDCVVIPFKKVTEEEQALLDSVSCVPLNSVLCAPRLDHVCVLVSDLEKAIQKAKSLGFPISKIEHFAAEGTTEVYIGEAGRAARLLLVQATAEGPYQRALQKRGPGLHHVGVFVDSLADFVKKQSAAGWMVHEGFISELYAERSAEQNLDHTLFLYCKGAPFLLEVSKKPFTEPRILEPVVREIHIHCEAEIGKAIDHLFIPELFWSSTSFQTQLKIGKEYWTAPF